jgi:hypothetical protein
MQAGSMLPDSLLHPCQAKIAISFIWQVMYRHCSKSAWRFHQAPHSPSFHPGTCAFNGTMPLIQAIVPFLFAHVRVEPSFSLPLSGNFIL